MSSVTHYVGCCTILFLQARQQCTEIQLPAGNTDAQRRQRINEAVERLIASLFAVPQYFFPAIHPFFDLLFSSQLMRFGLTIRNCVRKSRDELVSQVA